MPLPSSPLPRAWVALTACLAALVLVLAVAGSSALGSGREPAGPRPLPGQESQSPRVQVLLDQVEPAVIGPGVPWRVTGTISNTTTEPVPVSEIRASTAYVGLDTRGSLASWAAGDSGVTTSRVVGLDDLDAELAPGASSSFSIAVPAGEVGPPFAFATLPLRLEVLSESATAGQVRTFLPWYAVAAPDPTLSVSWLVPLTVPADPGLTAEDPDVRSQAWVEAIGPDSSVRMWLDELAGHAATYVVDPALLAPLLPAGQIAQPAEVGPGETTPTADDPADGATGAPATGTAPPTATAPGPAEPTPEPTPGGAPGPEPLEVLTDIEQAEVGLQSILTGLGENRLWWLPVNDPDLAALLELQTSAALVQTQLSTRLPADALLTRPLLDRGRHDVAWPAWASVPPTGLSALTARWPWDLQELSAVVVPGTAVDVPFDNAVGNVTVVPATDGSRAAELALIGYDTTISGVVARAPAADRDGASVQRLVAEMLAVHQELGPGTPRSIVIAPPRGTRIGQETLSSMVSALEAAPWLRHTPVAELLPGAPEAELADTEDADTAVGGPTAYPAPLPSPLSNARISDLESLRSTVAEVATILPTTDGVQRWGLVLDGLYSTRWRQGADSWETPLTELHDQVDTVLAGVRVNPTQVNFLADQGIISMTVVNDLPITVRGLTLHVEPGNGRLRITEPPEEITIGPDSRATVTFRARAVASGEVPVRAYLTTPTGLQVGETQILQVRVQPTGAWIYWVLGGVAGVILVLGLGRALRQPRPARRPVQPPYEDETDEDPR